MKLLQILIASMLFTITIIVSYLFYTKKNIVFIDNGKVFSEYKMTKETDKEVLEIEKGKKQILDSLIDVLKKNEAGIIKIEPKQLEFFKQEYLYKSKQFNDELNNIRQQNIEKIWKQVNLYVKDFAKENNYSVVLGANGQGALMYAEESINVTDRVIKFINDKYENKN